MDVGGIVVEGETDDEGGLLDEDGFEDEGTDDDGFDEEGLTDDGFDDDGLTDEGVDEEGTVEDGVTGLVDDETTEHDAGGFGLGQQYFGKSKSESDPHPKL